MPSPAPRSRWRVRLLAAAAMVELVVGVVATQAVEPGPGAQGTVPAAATARARVVVADPARALRTDGVRALLDARAAAVLGKDRAAFLATVDPQAVAFRTMQAKLIDALRDVPIGTWAYDLNPDAERAADADLDKRHGPGWWAPDVVLRYGLKGYDKQPLPSNQYLTFVQRGTRWYIAADADFKPISQDSGRALWDGGPVLVVKGASSLVLGHPRSKALLTTIAGAMDRAVPQVNAFWGTGWSGQVVVLVPDNQSELNTILGSVSDFSQIAAVATAELADGHSPHHPVGERVIVNPANFNKLGALGRRVVLTHEVTHVASRAATGPFEPTWLVEGIADYSGYLGLALPLSITARDLREDLRKGKPVTRLPSAQDFDTTNAALPQAYERAWLAVVRLVERYGQPKLLAFYRAVGAADSAAAAQAAFTTVLGTTDAAFEKEWAADLASKLR